MGIPPIRIDCPLSPPPIPAPSSAESAYLGAREPSQRALSNRISSQPKVIRHPRRGGGWGWSPGKHGEAMDTGSAKSARKKRQREGERKREREETKDKKGRRGSERNAGQDESRQRIRLNFFACDVRPLPPLFPPCLAREIQFSCPHASTHDPTTTTYHDNGRPRSTELHPCTSPATSCRHR